MLPLVSVSTTETPVLTLPPNETLSAWVIVSVSRPETLVPLMSDPVPLPAFKVSDVVPLLVTAPSVMSPPVAVPPLFVVSIVGADPCDTTAPSVTAPPDVRTADWMVVVLAVDVTPPVKVRTSVVEASPNRTPPEFPKVVAPAIVFELPTMLTR